jgi:hypothetical protein
MLIHQKAALSTPIKTLRKAAAANLFRATTVLCVTLAVILWVGPRLIRQDLFSDDAEQHLFWMYRFFDPQLFPNDFRVEFYSSSSVAPWGYQALYYMLGQVLDLQVAGELMAAVLLVWSAFLVYKIAGANSDDAELRGLLAVLAMIVLLPVLDLEVLPRMALQRTFAFPITLLCLWAMVARRYVYVGVSWILAALFYPVTLVVLGVSGAGVLLLEVIRERKLPRAAILNALLGVASLGIAAFNGGPPPGFGPSVTAEQARTMPEFLQNGREAIFGDDLFHSLFLDGRMGLGVAPWLLACVVVAMLFLAWRRQRIPMPVWVLFFVSLVVWFTSRQVVFSLYLPNRHARWGVACLAIFAFAAAAYAILKIVAHRTAAAGLRSKHYNESPPRTLDYIIALMAPLMVVAALSPVAHRVFRAPISTDMEAAYRFLSTLPKDTLIAAHPDIASAIPFRSKRSVLVSTKTSVPFMAGYYARVKPRLEASLRAAYATSAEEMDASLSPYGVDVMLTNRLVWNKKTYYAPFDGLVKQLRERGDRLGYALQSPPAGRILFHSGHVYVVRVGTPNEQAAAR